jgi:hypothetical protein
MATAPKHSETDETTTDETTTDETPKSRGRLVLATGKIVAAPEEGLQVSTHHYDEDQGATVPVVATFVLD